MTDPTQDQIKAWKQQYSTPGEFLEWVEAVVLPHYAHGKITLDTCALPWNNIAKHFIAPTGTMFVDGMVGCDGLKTSWKTAGAAWCNPGFSDILPWARKARLEADAGQLSVMLTHAAHASGWAQWTINNGASACWLVNPRINFIEAPQLVSLYEAVGKKLAGNNRDSMLWVFDPAHRGPCHFINPAPWKAGKARAA